MSDRLEDFIRNNKHEFDDKTPSDRVWENINKELAHDLAHKKKDLGEKASFSWVWKIAAVFFFFTSSWFVAEKVLKNGEEPASEVALSPEYQEFKAADNYYTSLINEKKAEIEAFQLANVNLEEEFLNDVNKLDSMYLELKNELENFQYNEKLMDAVIRNLQLRVEILNQQINLLQKIQSVKEQEETVSI